MERCVLTGYPAENFTVTNSLVEYETPATGKVRMGAIWRQERLNLNDVYNPILAGYCRQCHEAGVTSDIIVKESAERIVTEEDYPTNFDEKKAYLLRFLHAHGGAEYKPRNLFAHRDYTLCYAQDHEEFKRLLVALHEEGLVRWGAIQHIAHGGANYVNVTLTAQGIREAMSANVPAIAPSEDKPTMIGEIVEEGAVQAGLQLEASEPMVKHIFIDVVGFTSMGRNDDAQRAIIESLNRIVLKALAFHGIKEGAMTRRLLPTGDGLCICLLNADGFDIQIRMSLFILKEIHEHNTSASATGMPSYQVRIGLNMKHDLLVDDINGNPNVAGKGINMASRIMDAAGPSQILMSRAVQEQLEDRGDYPKKLRKGTISAKHGATIEVYQYVDTDCEGLDSSDVLRFLTEASSLQDSRPSGQILPIGPRSKREWNLLVQNWKVNTVTDTPQHTATKEIPLNGLLLERFRCRLSGNSDYVRFGVKLLGQGMDLFGRDRILTSDGSHVVHLAKDGGKSTVYAVHYLGTNHESVKQHIFQWANEVPVTFELFMGTDDMMHFRVNHVVVMSFDVDPVCRQRIVMMAWGDGNQYHMTVDEIKVERSHS